MCRVKMDGGIKQQHLMVRGTTSIVTRAMFGWLLVSEAD